MPDDKFETNLLRVIVAELYFLSGMTASREMYGKGYFSLGAGEKVAVDQAVQSLVFGNYHATTPEALSPKSASTPVGFQPPTEKPKA